MSYQEIEGLTKADLKNKLSQMGMSLDRIDHPRDYYIQLYLEKSNAKNKITCDDTKFYRNQMLHSKREREKGKEIDKELKEDPNYEEEEYEEEEEIIDDEDYDSLAYESSEEFGEKGEKNQKGKYSSKRKNAKKLKIDINNNNYKESGIKITRLIRKKKETNPANKVILRKQDNVKNKILNNDNEMIIDDNDINNTENIIVGQKPQNQYMNLKKDSKNKNNEFYEHKNNVLSDNNSETISLKVEKYKENTNNNDNHQIINLNTSVNIKAQNQNSEVIQKQNNIVSFGAPKNTEIVRINISNGPVKFGVNQSSPIFNKDESQNIKSNNEDKAKQYDFFIKNITKSIKDDVNDRKNDFHHKKVVLKWDTPQQKEFLCSSMEKEQTFRRPHEEENNNLNKVNLKYKFDSKNYEKEGIDKNVQKNQVVKDSIKNTIISAYDNTNKNTIDNNDYKSKLRSYSSKNKKISFSNDKNENILIEEENENNEIEYKDSDFQNNNYNLNANTIENNNRNNYPNLKMDEYGVSNNNTKNYNNIYQNINNTKKNYLINFNSMRNLAKNNYYDDDDDKAIKMKDNDINYFINGGDNMNNSYNLANKENLNNIQNPYANNNPILEDKILYINESDDNINGNMDKEQNINNNIKKNIPQMNETRNVDSNNNCKGIREGLEARISIESSENNKGKVRNYSSNQKNSIMSKFTKNVYLWPLIFLILFGIVFLLNYNFEKIETSNIFIIFTIIMALLLLYNLYKYKTIIKNYKKMAKEDKDELIKCMDRNDIKIEELENNSKLINEFIKSRIKKHKTSSEVYMKYIFPYLSKLLKKDKYDLKREDRNNEGNR